jgi:ubiquinone biosynthesis protein COQ4
VAFIVLVALVQGRTVHARRFILQGLRRGLRARWLPAEDWEALLPLPLTEVRERLALGPPPRYETYRSEQYRADQAAA